MQTIDDGPSMTQFWGTQLSTVGNRGFIFNASLQLQAQTTEATKNGAAYIGSFPVHSFHGSSTSIEISKLIDNADECVPADSIITLVNSI